MYKEDYALLKREDLMAIGSIHQIFNKFNNSMCIFRNAFRWFFVTSVGDKK